MSSKFKKLSPAEKLKLTKKDKHFYCNKTSYNTRTVFLRKITLEVLQALSHTKSQK